MFYDDEIFKISQFKKATNKMNILSRINILIDMLSLKHNINYEEEDERNFILMMKYQMAKINLEIWIMIMMSWEYCFKIYPKHV